MSHFVDSGDFEHGVTLRRGDHVLKPIDSRLEGGANGSESALRLKAIVLLDLCQAVIHLALQLLL